MKLAVEERAPAQQIKRQCRVGVAEAGPGGGCRHGAYVFPERRRDGIRPVNHQRGSPNTQSSTPDTRRPIWDTGPRESYPSMTCSSMRTLLTTKSVLGLQVAFFVFQAEIVLVQVEIVHEAD